MKLRIKYTKTGAVRFIGHLDLMRHFQKAIKRAKLDIAYTQGYSPHQILSFAAPMPLGMTSEGEYFDAEFRSVTTMEDMRDQLNAVMPPEIQVLDIVELPEGAKSCMAAVYASDYIIYHQEECERDIPAELSKFCAEIMEQPSILVMKKTKSKEEMSDIKPLITELAVYEPQKHGENHIGVEQAIYMKLAAGSVNNLKPELVLTALCERAGIEFNRYDYSIHRLETYME